MTRWSIDRSQLLHDDQPVLLLGGQLYNSSASDGDTIARSFARVRDLGGNTVIAPAYWDLCEQNEAEFNFDLVDRMLSEADRTDLRLVVLWFGAFKNAASTYAPTGALRPGPVPPGARGGANQAGFQLRGRELNPGSERFLARAARSHMRSQHWYATSTRIRSVIGWP